VCACVCACAVCVCVRVRVFHAVTKLPVSGTFDLTFTASYLHSDVPLNAMKLTSHLYIECLD
jgi:hypothetical protein